VGREGVRYRWEWGWDGMGSDGMGSDGMGSDGMGPKGWAGMVRWGQSVWIRVCGGILGRT